MTSMDTNFLSRSRNETLVRILLPGRSRDGSLRSWAQIAIDSGFPGEVDGYSDWSELVELRPGIDPTTLPVAAAGWIDAATSTRLLNALGPRAQRPWSWWTVCAPREEDPPDEAFESLSLLLQAHGSRFSGRAASHDVAFAAPPYADSLLMTGPAGLAQELSAVGLEVHRVSTLRNIPIWTD